MKIQYISDLHLDYSNLNYLMTVNKLNNKTTGANVLVVAGDTCQLNSEAIKNRFIDKMLHGGWDHIIEVPGNHDFYQSRVENASINYNDKIKNKKRVYHYVNNQYIDIGDVRFICATLWSDVKTHARDVQQGMNDFGCIMGNTINLHNERHMESMSFIKKTLDNTDDSKKCVVVSHHLPLFELVGDDFMHSRINEGYATNLTSFFYQYGHKISAWIHGHSHSSMDCNFYGVNFVRNPFGYCRDFGALNEFLQDKILENNQFGFNKTIDIGS